MSLENRQRPAPRHQFRLLADAPRNDHHPVHQNTLRPMLFHPDYRDSSPTAPESGNNIGGSVGDLRMAFDMFSPTSPSPTRTMIKEANDHLQLLHQRVVELEKTVQEQAEALIKKDESMQSKMKEMSEMKEGKIREMAKLLESSEQKAKKLEVQCRDKDAQIEYLLQKCAVVDELTAYTPILDRMAATLKKLPKPSGNSTRVKHSKVNNTRGNAKTRNASTQGSSYSEVDGHPPNQAMSDLRLSRSFSINQNFSMSEDEGEEYS